MIGFCALCHRITEVWPSERPGLNICSVCRDAAADPLEYGQERVSSVEKSGKKEW